MADYGAYEDYGTGYGGYPANYPAFPRTGGGGHYNGYPPAGPPGYPPIPGGFDPAGAQYQQSPLDAEVASVMHEIRNEITGFENTPEFGEQYRNAKRLLTSELTKLENNVDPEWLELDIEKQIKLVKKVLIPAFRYPRFNFVGKVIGPKGVTLQNIAKTFKCHVYVLGRGSSRDKAKEQELLATGDPQYAHFNGPLHVKIETTAPPALAYKRVAGVLEVLGELLKPVKETYIEGITPMPESMKKESGGTDDEKKEQVEESKIKIEGDYGQDNDDSKASINPPASNGSGNRGGSTGSRGRGRGGFNDRGGRGGGRGDYHGPKSFPSSTGPPRGGGPMRNFGFGGPMAGGPRGPPNPLMGGRGGGRGGPDRGRGRGGPPRFNPY